MSGPNSVLGLESDIIVCLRSLSESTNSAAGYVASTCRTSYCMSLASSKLTLRVCLYGGDDVAHRFVSITIDARRVSSLNDRVAKLCSTMRSLEASATKLHTPLLQSLFENSVDTEASKENLPLMQSVARTNSPSIPFHTSR